MPYGISKENDNMKKNDIALIVAVSAVVAAIIGFILNCIVFPVGYIMFHSCDKWLCGHHYPVTWLGFFIISGLAFMVLLPLCIYSESSSNSTYVRRAPRRSTQRRNNDLETNYYDSDMEGAPGYNGFE